MKDVAILDTTLRDGNYVVDFQFTARDSAWMAEQLQAAGIRLIEIGHGLGLGASEKFKPAGATDEAYIRAVRGVLSAAKFGMFAIPGVATTEHIAMAADHGMDFIRIGADTTRVRELEPLVKEARRRGLYVYTNFMKSYGTSPEALGELGKMAEGFGSQLNYVVDSAGGMLPEDVSRYCEALLRLTGVPVGFHAHDNLRLAMGNTLAALKAGATLIDTTLFGVGRGSGNSATELVVGILKQRLGALPDIDEYALLRLAETQAQPLLRNRKQEVLSMSMGLAQVHSMYQDRILKAGKERNLDPHLLMREVGRIDRIDCDPQTIDMACRAVPPGKVELSGQGWYAVPSIGTPADRAQAAEAIANKLAVPLVVTLVEREAAAPDVTVEIRDFEVRLTVTGDPAGVLAVLTHSRVASEAGATGPGGASVQVAASAGNSK